MSYRITITGKDHYTLIELFGELDLSKVIATNAYLYRDDSFVNHPYAVWDFTESTLDFEMEHVLQLAQQVLQERPITTPGKTAFITSDLEKIGFAVPLVELVGESRPVEIKGFSTRVAAIQWVTSNHTPDQKQYIEL